MKKGYPVLSGYEGQMQDGKWYLFASEADYNEAYDAYENKEEA